MKKAILNLVLLAGLARLQAATEPEAGDGKPLLSRITDVTVYADRAQVTRSAAVELPSETIRFSFEQLPGWIDEGSLRVALAPPEAGQILDVQIRRTYLARPGDEDFRKAESAVRDIADQIAALDDEKSVLDAQSKQIDSMRVFSLDKLPKDSAVREIKPSEYAETVKFVAASLRELAAGKREIERKKRDLQPELTARQRKLEELRQRSQLEQRTVVATLKGEAKKATLSLSYMLPGATWEPVHELRATPDGRTVGIASYAVIRQTSGEDWTGVNLSLSTQRSTETMKIPELEALLVGAGRKIAQVAASSRDSFSAASKSFGDQNRFWFNLRNNDTALQQEYVSNQAMLLDNVKRVEVVFQKLQDRGTTAHFPALGAQTIRSDGRAVRAPISRVELAAQHRIFAAPEMSLNAAHTVELSNTGKQSILPGKVSLYLDGAFLGLTEADYVAPGESFSLYLGVADEIKLARTLDRKRSEFKRGGQRAKVQASFVVTVENLSDKAAAVQLADRLPVSESDEVKVGGIRIAPEAKPDVKGLLRWDVTLGAKQSKEFRIEYYLEYPNDLPERKFAQEANQSASPAFRLHEQIRDLETKLK